MNLYTLPANLSKHLPEYKIPDNSDIDLHTWPSLTNSKPMLPAYYVHDTLTNEVFVLPLLSGDFFFEKIILDNARFVRILTADTMPDPEHWVVFLRCPVMRCMANHILYTDRITDPNEWIPQKSFHNGHISQLGIIPHKVDDDMIHNYLKKFKLVSNMTHEQIFLMATARSTWVDSFFQPDKIANNVKYVFVPDPGLSDITILNFVDFICKYLDIDLSTETLDDIINNFNVYHNGNQAVPNLYERFTKMSEEVQSRLKGIFESDTKFMTSIDYINTTEIDLC